ncbi:hypothetical protein MWU59_08725 [Flavobacteriaceae bacterium F08102]|nr:hypothetical protein [Flavobacteriaceae bacterium F08102]
MLILLFVYAATNKLIEFDEFNTQLSKSPIIAAFADWLVYVIPITELMIGFLFLINWFTTLAFYASFSLLIMFTTYIVLIMKFSEFIPCSCGGVLDQLGWGQHLIFNLVFIIITGIGLYQVDSIKPLK